MKWLINLLIAAVALVFSSFNILPAYSDVVTVEFSGEIYYLVDEYDTFDPDIPDTIAGTYSYDTDAEDMRPERYIGQYIYPPLDAHIEATLGGHALAFYQTGASDILVQVENDAPDSGHDSFKIEALNGSTFDGLLCESGGLSLFLYNYAGTALLNKDHDELPIGEPDLFAWDLTNVGFVCQILETLEPIDIHIGAFITSLSLVNDTPLEQLVVAIDRLVADGFISEQRANGLRTKLLRASVKFTGTVGADKTVQACNQMEAFINQVNGLGRKFIPEQDAALLLSLANEVMIEEGCLQ